MLYDVYFTIQHNIVLHAILSQPYYALHYIVFGSRIGCLCSSVVPRILA